MCDTRCQLSLELMLYVALAGLSFAFALSVFSNGASAVSHGISAFEISQFTDLLNVRLLGGAAGAFSAFVPRGSCNATTIRLVRPAVVGNALCPDGTSATLAISYNGAVAYLSRG